MPPLDAAQVEDREVKDIFQKEENPDEENKGPDEDMYLICRVVYFGMSSQM